MNKSKITIIAIGGVAALAVLVMAFFAWSAYSAKLAALEGDEEGNVGLETVVAKAEQLSRKAPYPCAQSVKAVESNQAAVVEWKDDACRLAARGDRTFKAMTASEFKSFIEQDAKRLAALPGAVMGKVMKDDFAFGPFREFLIEGKMPAEDPAKLAVLQRQWDDLATVIETLAAGGIAEMLGVELKVAAEAPKDDGDKNKKKKKKSAKKPKPGAAEAAKEPVAYSYVFTFTSQAPGFVKAVNSLETCERFIVVDNFTFARDKDAIMSALGETEKKENAPQAGRRRRRGAAAAAEEAAAKQVAENGIITDPAVDAPFKVTMSVTIYDFRTLEGGAESTKPTEEAGK